jgi:hypothetical protein
MDFEKLVLLADLSRMDANTCAALAQIAPVFLIAFIAERIIPARKPLKPLSKKKRKLVRQRSREIRAKRLGARLLHTFSEMNVGVLFRLSSVVALAIMFLVLEWAMLLGIGMDGYSGKNALAYWLLTFLLTATVLIRWAVGNMWSITLQVAEAALRNRAKR